MKSRHSLVNQLMSRYTYSQKFLFISLLFALSIATLSYLYIQQKRESIQSMENERNGIRYLRNIRFLLEHVPKHRLLAIRYLQGDLSVRNDLLASELQIDSDFKKLKMIDRELGDELKTRDVQFKLLDAPIINLQDVERSWQTLKSQKDDLDYDSLNLFHDELIRSIQNLKSHIGDSSQLVLDSKIATYYLMSNLLVRLPEYQNVVNKLIMIGSKAIHNKVITPEDRFQIISLMGVLQLQVEYIQQGMKKAYSNTGNINEFQDFKPALEPQVNNFLTSNREFVKIVEQDLLESKENKVSLSLRDFLEKGETTLADSFKLWDLSIEQLDALLEMRIKNAKFEEYVGLLSAFIIALLAFLMGLFIMSQISIPLNNLIDATHKLASGNLASRVQIFYHDEIGRVGIAFNNMAQSLETIITQLRDLLEATRRLSAGDFTARVMVSNATEDVEKVGEAFNNLAQSFEDIISQLHQLGINLTTSATQIAAASKEQETIIMEQEATTREISVTANEISTTAKEFANTVSEVSKVAEDTSALAMGGRESLTHMESIMRQMVDASGNIGSKLAVLNEKAGNITSVITTITKVADQTNLLSLNAAIEAEKAGEYGRSFAVIAREIRRLADQTAYATLDIEKIVNEIMGAVSSSVMGVDDFTQEIRVGVEQVSKVSEQLAKIMEQVQVLTERFESVNQGMQAQSAGAEQINEAISQLSQTAQQTTESIHQFRNTIQQLNSAATDLRVAVSRMKK